MDVRVSDDPTAAAAAFIAERLRMAVTERNIATLAVSGGSTAPPMFAAMLDESVAGSIPWAQTTVWQVDERVAPDGDDDRNAMQLQSILAPVELMPVTETDLAAAARRYGASVTDPLDVVHLGMGDDGHTASWPPEPHPYASSAVGSDGRAFVVGEFNGRIRMTLGPSVVNAARCRVVLTTGASKAEAVALWIGSDRDLSSADPTLPITAVVPDDTVVFLDEAAAANLER